MVVEKLAGREGGAGDFGGSIIETEMGEVGEVEASVRVQQSQRGAEHE